jgi:hypothetical protein
MSSVLIFTPQDSATHESLRRGSRHLYQHIEPALKERLTLGQPIDPAAMASTGVEPSSGNGQPRPGALFAEAHRTLRLICLVLGLRLHCRVDLLQYAGTTPVNISPSLSFHFTQTILLLLIVSWSSAICCRKSCLSASASRSWAD